MQKITIILFILLSSTQTFFGMNTNEGMYHITSQTDDYTLVAFKQRNLRSSVYKWVKSFSILSESQGYSKQQIICDALQILKTQKNTNDLQEFSDFTSQEEIAKNQEKLKLLRSNMHSLQKIKMLTLRIQKHNPDTYHALQTRLPLRKQLAHNHIIKKLLQNDDLNKGPNFYIIDHLNKKCTNN